MNFTIEILRGKAAKTAYADIADRTAATDRMNGADTAALAGTSDHAGRRESAAGSTVQFVQTFRYETEDLSETVATVLTRLNEQDPLSDADGKEAAPIRWECSCLQRKCGACAMIINDRPRLACDAVLADYKKKKRIRLEPLRKFPLVEDLVVDRTVLQQNLKELRAWFSNFPEAKPGENTAGSGACTQPAEDAFSLPYSHRRNDLAYEASRCLQCGCCLEVCPNFHCEGAFAGMAAAVPVTRILSGLPDNKRDELRAIYERRIYEGCGKSLACRSICPAGIDIDRMLVNSNAAAVWKRLLR